MTHALVNSFDQVWPPFALIAGLLLMGRIAASDGLFESVGARLARIPGGGLVMFAAMMTLVALVTTVLNLDTSVVFLTPVLIHAARQRGVKENAFLYGAIFMSNGASLLLPGSNLTNILVLTTSHVRRHVFAAGCSCRGSLRLWSSPSSFRSGVGRTWTHNPSVPSQLRRCTRGWES